GGDGGRAHVGAALLLLGGVGDGAVGLPQGVVQGVEQGVVVLERLLAAGVPGEARQQRLGGRGDGDGAGAVAGVVAAHAVGDHGDGRLVPAGLAGPDEVADQVAVLVAVALPARRRGRAQRQAFAARRRGRGRRRGRRGRRGRGGRRGR